MISFTLILPSSFNHKEEKSAIFLSEISLLNAISECSINISWYIHNISNSNKQLLQKALFINDLLHIREKPKLYRTIEAAMVSHLCRNTKNKNNSDLIVFLPSTVKEPSTSSLSSQFTSCDIRIMFLAYETFLCNDSKHFLFSYNDNLWPSKLVQCLLYNSVSNEHIFENKSVSDEKVIPKQSLFWLCSKCFTGISLCV